MSFHILVNISMFMVLCLIWICNFYLLAHFDVLIKSIQKYSVCLSEDIFGNPGPVVQSGREELD